MKKFAAFLVDKRIIVLLIMLSIAIASACLIPMVEINSDLTKYLADDSEMRKGLDIMNSEFPPMGAAQTIRVMFVDLDENGKTDALKRLKEVKGVESVSYDESESYNKENYTLYIINTAYEYGSKEFEGLEKRLSSDFKDCKMYFHNDSSGIGDFPLWVVGVAMAILIAILLVMCGSWFEPVLFLAVIGIAIVINLGTNLIMGSISSVTFSIAAILQLVLSMDYSIILMNRYRAERKLTDDKYSAMKTALAGSVSSIGSSAFTTVVGLLMLLFMSFKIGLDLGIVLAKGVFISMICVFTVLPSFILFCDKVLLKTEKKGRQIKKIAKENGERKAFSSVLANFSHKSRYILTGVFVALFAGIAVLQTFTPIKYTLETEDPIAEVFDTANQFVLIYENKDEEKLESYASKLAENKKVTQVLSYGSTLGKKMRADEIMDGIGDMAGAAGGSFDAFNIDEGLIKLVYYGCNGGETENIGADYLLDALNLMANDVFMAPLTTQKEKQAIKNLNNYDGEKPAGILDKSTLTAFLRSAGAEIEDNTLDAAMFIGSALQNYNPEWKISIKELFDYVYDDLMNDVRFEKLFNEIYKGILDGFKKQLDEGAAQLRGENYSRMVVITTLPIEAEETKEYYDKINEIRSEFDGDSYLIGNSAMNYEMAQSFDKELLLITLLTIFAIFIVVLITFKNVLIPVFLCLLVQGAVYVTVCCLHSSGVFYLALLIVECILMGATIDYGILFTNFYREARKNSGVKEALKKAYDGSIHTILTSGLILVLVTGIIGVLSSDPTMNSICIAISVGSLAAILLITLILPGLLAALDKFVLMTVPVEKLFKKKKNSAETEKSEIPNVAIEVAAEEDGEPSDGES